VPVQRSLIMQTSSPPDQHVTTTSKNLRSSYARSLISQCTSSSIDNSVSTPLGDRRQRSYSYTHINGSEPNLSNEAPRSQTNTEASANPRNRSQHFSYVNRSSEIASHRTLLAQPSIQDSFSGQEGATSYLPFG
jgi:hypothetical protein